MGNSWLDQFCCRDHCACRSSSSNGSFHDRCGILFFARITAITFLDHPSSEIWKTDFGMGTTRPNSLAYENHHYGLDRWVLCELFFNFSCASARENRVGGDLP